MMLAIPIPPTISAIDAIASSTIDMVAMIALNVPIRSSCETTVKSTLSLCRRPSTSVISSMAACTLALSRARVIKLVNPSSANRSSAVVSGIITRSSRSKPSEVPLCSISPITRNSASATLTILPSGFSSPNSSACSTRPSTT